MLVDAEQRMNKMDLLSQNHKGKKYFQARASPSYVEDDHIPFMKRGVPILHIIPKQFPSVWHKLSDNMSALDFNTIADLNKILRVFVAEYLHLDIPS